MGRTRYDDATKARAVALALEVGKAEAARRLEIPAGTIGSWMSRTGVATMHAETTRAATEARQAKWQERRVEMIHEIGDAAALALARVREELGPDGKLRDAKDAATTMAILVDKAQLLSGGATSRYGTDADRQKVLRDAHREGLSLVSDAA